MSKATHYMVIIGNIDSTPELFISDSFHKEATSATLKDVPLLDEGRYSVNVAVYYENGYAYSEQIEFVW